jgi:hypothetical protein
LIREGEDGESRQSSELGSLRGRLDARREEIEQAALARIAAIAHPVPDPVYASGLRAALAAALDYGLAAIAAPERAPEPVPVELLAQARLAARHGVSLDAVLRRYAAGHSLLADRLLDEAAALRLGAVELKLALRALAVRHERVVAAVTDEYERDIASLRQSPARRRSALIGRLLGGEPLDPAGLGYPLEGHHLALVACGEGMPAALQRLGKRSDRRLLLSEPDNGTTWAWLGGRHPFTGDELGFIANFRWPEGGAVACGESGNGLVAWRFSHHQATAALLVAKRSAEVFVRYTDVALLAAVLQDDLLAGFLRRAYLEPLQADRDRGKGARATLRAYFGAARNVSSAAAALGVHRQTVATRLAAIEERLGRRLEVVATDLEIALRLDEFDRSSPRFEENLEREVAPSRRSRRSSS